MKKDNSAQACNIRDRQANREARSEGLTLTTNCHGLSYWDFELSSKFTGCCWAGWPCVAMSQMLYQLQRVERRHTSERALISEITTDKAAKYVKNNIQVLPKQTCLLLLEDQGKHMPVSECIKHCKLGEKHIHYYLHYIFHNLTDSNSYFIREHRLLFNFFLTRI